MKTDLDTTCGVRDHTSLRAWQEAHAISIAVIRLVRSSWKPYAAALFSQLQRASLSIQLNIAEGYTFGESPTFTRHLAIAYGSAVETGELLRLAKDAEVVADEPLEVLLVRCRQTERLLLGMLKRRRKFDK
jgi:four helix bundle protein